MALNLGTVSDTRYINHGNLASASFTSGTFIVLINSQDTTPLTDAYVLGKSGGSWGWGCDLFIDYGADYWRFVRNRATTSCMVHCVDPTLGATGWWWVAVTFDTGGSASDQKAFKARPGTLLTDVTDSGGVGAGTVANVASYNFNVGYASGYGPFAGYVGGIYAWNNRVLTAAQMNMQIMQPDRLLFPTSCAVYCHYGIHGSGGTGTQRDWSGNGNNGTVTSATKIDHPGIKIFPTWQFMTPPAAAGVSVTPAAATAIGSKVDPTVIYGSVSVTPTETSAIGSTVNPTVVLGSLSITPATTTAIGTTVDPTVVIGDLVITPSASTAIGSTVDPTVVYGSVVITPSASTAIGSTVDPTVVYGSLTVAPSAVTAIGSTVDPTVSIGTGNVVVTPTASSAIGTTVDPTVVITQYLRPDGDVSAGVWTYSTGSTLYGVIDEATRDDADYILSSAGGTGYCEVTLSNPGITPNVDTGHIVRYTYMRTNGAKSYTLVVSLRQGTGTEIANWSHVNPGTSFTLAEQTLSEAQAANITDYTDLRLRFNATVSQNPGYGEVSWAEVALPVPVGVTVAPSAASAIGSTVDPTVVYGSVSIAPTAASAIGSTVDPTVVYGSVSITPAAVTAIGSTVDPTVVIGDLVITPSAASAIASTVDPTVIYGSVVVTTTAVSAIGSTVDPTVVLGSLTIAPTAISAIGSTVDPTVVIGDLVIAPTAASAIGSTVDPTVIYGSLSIAPSAVTAIGATIDPTVDISGAGDVIVTPNPVSAIASTIAPTVLYGSTSVTPAVASAVASTVDPTVVLGSMTVAPTAASAVASTIDPTVIRGSIAITPSASTAIASTVNPTLILSSTSVTPAVASAIGATVDPTVLLVSPLAIDMAITTSAGYELTISTARRYNLALSESARYSLVLSESTNN